MDDGSAVPLQAPPGWDGPPLHIIRTSNQGLAAARNLALRNASGEFVAFLDSDDFWHPRKVEVQEQALQADPAAVACYTRCVQAPGFYGFGPYPPGRRFRRRFSAQFSGLQLQFFSPSSVMARRETKSKLLVLSASITGNGEDVEVVGCDS